VEKETKESLNTHMSINGAVVLPLSNIPIYPASFSAVEHDSCCVWWIRYVASVGRENADPGECCLAIDEGGGRWESGSKCSEGEKKCLFEKVHDGLWVKIVLLST
jgi:hypothetical protein